MNLLNIHSLVHFSSLPSEAMVILFKSILKNQTLFQTLFKPQFVSPSIISRTLTSEANHKKPLSVLFEEVVGLRPKSETSEIEEDNELKRKLLELERKLIELKKSEPVRTKKQKGKVVSSEQTEKRQNLYKLFKGDEEKDLKKHSQEKEVVVRVYKELPLEMVSFVKLLHKEGYLNKANFIPGEKLDMGSLDEEYSRTFVKFAAERFGKDYQEIAK